MNKKIKIKINLQICPLPVIAHAYKSNADFFKFNSMTFQLWGNPQYFLWVQDIIISISISIRISIGIIISITFFLVSIFKFFSTYEGFPFSPLIILPISLERDGGNSETRYGT